MKRINKVNIQRQNELLEKEGIFSKEDLLGMTVVELIERIGESEIDLLLKRLLLDTYGENRSYEIFASQMIKANFISFSAKQKIS